MDVVSFDDLGVGIGQAFFEKRKSLEVCLDDHQMYALAWAITRNVGGWESTADDKAKEALATFHDLVRKEG